MKRFFAGVIAAMMVFGMYYCALAEDARPAKVIAYYFHGSFRCSTCTNMEAYAKEAIDTNFKDYIDTGRLKFESINVEERENEHFAEDYQLYSKSLILSLVKDGKEERSKNLDKIWELAGNKQKFMDYVTSEISDFLKDAQ